MKRTTPLLPSLFALTLVVSAGFASACSGGSETSGDGDDGGDGDGDSSDQLPADFSQASIEAFLAAETYKAWVGDPAIRTETAAGNPHGGNLRVYFNDAAVTSAQNQAADEAAPAEAGTMVVKEVYDAGGALLGHAVNIKREAGQVEAWTYYCDVNGTDFCGISDAQPIYMEGETFTGCSVCHGEFVLAPLP